jgi:hypothetical protein
MREEMGGTGVNVHNFGTCTDTTLLVGYIHDIRFTVLLA